MYVHIHQYHFCHKLPTEQNMFTYVCTCQSGSRYFKYVNDSKKLITLYIRTYIHNVHTYVQTLKCLCRVLAVLKASSRDFRTLLSAIFPPLPMTPSPLTVVSPSQPINTMLCCFFNCLCLPDWPELDNQALG